VYPALATLERRGLVDSKWEAVGVAHSDGRPRRRYYRITAEGRTELAAALRRLASLGLVAPKGVGGSAEGSPA
jgi:DNA-binding PadR family transcriptional regulator